jgi:hypothetical protein
MRGVEVSMVWVMLATSGCRADPQEPSSSPERRDHVTPMEIGRWLREESTLRFEGPVLGVSVAGGGDVDGDGHGDLVVGVVGEGTGAAYVFRADPRGVDAGTLLLPSDRDEPGTFGAMVADAGDLDGDGYDDVAVVAPPAWNLPDPSGAVYVYLGGPDGIEPSSEIKRLPDEKMEFYGPVASAGDVDGDGYDDLLVAGEKGIVRDGVFLYRGGPAGLSDRYRVLLRGPRSGWGDLTLAGAGDLNGDGYDDVVVGMPDLGLGEVYWMLGGPDGLLEPHLLEVIGSGRVGFGRSVCGAGDLNGDGYDDVAVSELNGAGVPYGGVYVYLGSAAGLSTPQLVLEPETPLHFGEALAGLGDVDGDGYDDLAVGTWDDLDRVAVLVYRGAPDGLSPEAPTALVGLLADPSYDTVSVASTGTHVAVGFLDYRPTEEGSVSLYPFCTDPSWYVDEDGDGYGGGTDMLCRQTEQATVDAGDCDDQDPAVSPSAPEVPGDGIDNDCDGVEEAMTYEPTPGAVYSRPSPFDLLECGCSSAGRLPSGAVLLLLWLLRRREGRG